MKSSILRTLVTLSLSAALSPSALMAQSQMCAKIPFSFTVGTQSFAPGDYCISQKVPSVLEIRGAYDRSAIVAMTTPGEKSKKAGVVVLTFNAYGEGYFLSEVSIDSQGWHLLRSPVEKELIAKRAPLHPVVVTAALSSQ